MAYILTSEDCVYLETVAKALARSFGIYWREDNGTTAVLRRPLRELLGDIIGCPTSVGPEEGAQCRHDFEGTRLEHRCQRFLMRGLVLHYWTEMFPGGTFRKDRYNHIGGALNAFGQELVED